MIDIFLFLLALSGSIILGIFLLCCAVVAVAILAGICFVVNGAVADRRERKVAASAFDAIKRERKRGNLSGVSIHGTRKRNE